MLAVFSALGSCSDLATGVTDPVLRRSQPLSSAASRAFVGLDLGDNFGCVVRHDGEVVCWGRNHHKQLGLLYAPLQTTDRDSLIDALTVGSTDDDPNAPNPFPMHAVGVAVGEAHACAVRENGGVKCWGSNSHLQVGYVITGDRAPFDVPFFNTSQDAGVASRQAASLSAGLRHTCAVLTDGHVACWGSNAQGQLGNPAAGAGTHTPTLVMTASSGGTTALESVVQVEAAGTQTCARTGDGRVFCWGVGALTGASNPLAVHLNNASEITDLAVGDEHVCIRGGDGSVWCRGSNWFGQLGRGFAGAPQTGFAPVLVPGGAALSQVASVFAGRYSTCAILGDGTARCWGAPYQGRLGSGYPAPDWTFAQPMAGVSHATAGSTGNTHSCVIAADLAGLRCAGSDVYGELGNGSATTGEQPTAVVVQMANWEFISNPSTGFGYFQFSPRETQGRATIVGGHGHFCTIRRSVINIYGGVESRVYCWGENYQGQAAPQSEGDSASAPTPLPLGGIPASLSAGHDFNCALFTDGTVKCWGNNNLGQCGPSLLGFARVQPQAIPGVSNAVAISSGDAHTCALIADGSTRCWGSNIYSQLGRGAPANPPDYLADSTPAPATSFTTSPAFETLGRVTAIAAGGVHTCAMRANGSVHCWGRYDTGAVGAGSHSLYLAPGTTDLVDARERANPVDSIRAHQASHPPYPVVDFLNFREVPAALWSNHSASCVRLASGMIQCWGHRFNGQVGDDPFGGGMPTQFFAQSQSSQPAQATAMAGRGGTNCVLRSDGQVYCWGVCSLLGRGEPCDSTSAVYNRASVLQAGGGPTLEGVVAVAVSGSGTACAVTGDSTVFCWGSNSLGALGANSTELSSTFPVPISL
ncbi:MAG: hypothetical protein R3A48_05435 [Polyangiales bacterium]